jgi:camphor 5-monooxygenase
VNAPISEPMRPAHVPQDRVVDFDIYNPFEVESDLHRAWVGMRESSPHGIIWTPHNEGHWIALDPDLISTVLSDSSRFSNRIVLVPKSTSGEAYSEFIPLSLDPPRHQPFRRILDEKLRGGSVNALESGIRALTASLIDAFVANGRCNFVHEFAEQLPLQVFMQLVDLPLENLPELKHLADQFTRPDGSVTPAEATAQFQRYLSPILKARKRSGRDDLLTHIADARIGDRDITEAEAVNLAGQAMVGGLDTVVNFMSFAMLTLARMPELQAEIAADPARIPKVVSELLRRLPIVSSGREVIGDVLVDGVTLAKGDVVVAPTELFALDQRVNRCPFDIEIDRPVKKQVTFGAGAHICPGQFLARMEIKILLEEWFARIPSFHLEPGQDIRHFGGVTAGTGPFTLKW